ncbi:hypothetical protein G8767_30160 [Rhodococcus sp. IC4_135]|uniref:hypothetical protein n=1 Tax=Rhodococcus sp. IC4_135 TaxID=2715537 RepID=UPI00141D78CB|nr:hypothetical protein [Rhodococcus sp. IC4_135]
MYSEAQRQGGSKIDFCDRDPLQRWLTQATRESVTDSFRRKVADRAHDLGAGADKSVLIHRLAEWQVDIKSGGRPVGLYVPRLVLEREITAVDPRFKRLYRDDRSSSGRARFDEAGQRLRADPSLTNDWLALTASFGKTFADHVKERYSAARIRLFRGVRGDAGELAGMAHDRRLSWARENLLHGTAENWSPLPGVAEGALNGTPGIVIGAEFDTAAVVCTHELGAETNVRPWRVESGQVITTFRYTSIDVYVR